MGPTNTLKLYHQIIIKPKKGQIVEININYITKLYSHGDKKESDKGSENVTMTNGWHGQWDKTFCCRTRGYLL